MGSTLEESPADLMLQCCHFPTPAKRQTERQHYKTMSIFDREEPFAGRELNIEIIQAVWAILLRSYTRNPIVSFAVYSDHRDGCSADLKNKEISFSATTGALIVQYELFEGCQLKNINGSRSKKFIGRVLGDSQINTAVDLAASLPLTNGQRNGESSRLIDSDRDVLNDSYDLILNVVTTLNGVSITYRWPTISQKYAQAVASTFRKTVKAILSDDELRICNLDLVREEDKQKMISWNPEDPFAQAEKTCMHHLVNAKAREIPAYEAICAWDGSLAYAQLEKLATVVAYRLIGLGVGPGIYVPFAYEKSLWTVVATLGILKAGGAFVPLNPQDPKARLGEILTNINADIVVTMDSLVPKFEDLVKHVVVVSAKTVFDDEPEHNVINISDAVAVGPTDPIFVLFTSGSTGQPKGMIHEHGAICTHAVAHGEAMHYHGARVLQFAAHTFDVAIMDIFTTLIYGGTICIPSEEDRRNNIIGVINSMEANHAILTPSFAGLIEPSEVPSLKTLAIGGEALPQDRIQRWAEKVSLISIYGPAEAGICLITPLYARTRPETVGYPLHNSSCWLVDPDDVDCLVPIGAVGELVVAGPSLARGYLNNEAKTRTSFFESPAWAVGLGLGLKRFYRTGDLLRYNTDSFDGSYEFVGRKDSQIKLRGQRIEPGEVEHHIGARIPEVAVSMVTRPEEGCFSGELVAVVQVRGTSTKSSGVRHEAIRLVTDQPLSIETFRGHLSKTLSNYMIPTVCLVINFMPLVPSLKIDRRAVNTWLMRMVSRPDEATISILAHLDAGEATAHVLSLRIAELVASTDAARQMRLQDHDFSLQEAGMDSIQVISLSMFLRRKFGKVIPMDALLNPKMTVRELASLIGDHSQSTNGHNPSSDVSQLTSAVDVFHESRVLGEDMLGSIETQLPNHDLKPHTPIRNVFLTGATGYLGSAILPKLFEIPGIQVFALIRCPTESKGLQRIIEGALTDGWWQDSYASNITVWVGDLTLPNLGLGVKELQILQGTEISPDLCIHAIIHNGARVHYSSNYSTLKPLNVLPTLELLNKTAQASTIASFVFVSGGQKPNIDTSAHDPSQAAALSQAGGYTQTKFVSERIVQRCVDHDAFRTKKLCTVKPGYIIGSLRTGVANQKDFIWRLIAGCVEIGACNRDEAEHWLFVADVDRVARAVVGGVFDDDRDGRGDMGRPSGSVERVLDGLLFSDVWELLEEEEFGYGFEALGQDEWMARLRRRVLEVGEEHLLFPLLHVLERDGGGVGEKVEGGEGRGFETEGVKEAVRRNVRYLVDVGFLPRLADAEVGRRCGQGAALV